MTLEVLGAVLVASFLGSLHCAAMCGGLVGAVGCGFQSRWGRLQASFHAGRGATYIALGAAAGAVGSAVNLAGTYAGVVDSAGLVAGVLVLGAGLRGLLVTRGVGVPALGAATGIQSWLRRRLVGSTPEPVLRAGVVGVSTALLPCGWLYAFVFAAAGTGTPLRGGAVLFAFWLGTLPALLGVGAAVRRLAAFGRHAALFSAVVLVALGLGTILHRVNIPAAALSQVDAAAARAGETEKLPCHSGETP